MADADKNFLTKLLREMRPGVLPVTPKQSGRVLNGDIPLAEETEIPTFSRTKTMLIIFPTLKTYCTNNSYQREK